MKNQVYLLDLSYSKVEKTKAKNYIGAIKNLMEQVIMAIYKFYNVQLLPIDKSVSEVGVDGYCRLFEGVGSLILECKEKKRKLSSIATKMRGEMFFAPFSVTVYEYDKTDKKRVIYGSFLKFDDVNVLVDTNSGETEYRSKGNTSSKRYDLEFFFDPKTHTLAIHDTKGLPARTPLIHALNEILGTQAIRLFKKHSLEIEELTSADSITEFLELPKKGYKKYEGIVTFSNSDSFDEIIESELKLREQELKDKHVSKWKTSYNSFNNSVMSDLPEQAKVQMALATKYGNAEVLYLDENGNRQKYQMENYPVREQLTLKEYKGVTGKAIAVLNLIKRAITKTKLVPSTIKNNKKFLDEIGD